MHQIPTGTWQALPPEQAALLGQDQCVLQTEHGCKGCVTLVLQKVHTKIPFCKCSNLLFWASCSFLRAACPEAGMSTTEIWVKSMRMQQQKIEAAAAKRMSKRFSCRSEQSKALQLLLEGSYPSSQKFWLAAQRSSAARKAAFAAYSSLPRPGLHPSSNL